MIALVVVFALMVLSGLVLVAAAVAARPALWAPPLAAGSVAGVALLPLALGWRS